jgi:hypothetical protein
MERNVRRISKWIERCALACKLKKWPEALLEIECARAELETVRSDLWERAEEASVGRVRVSRRGWVFPFRVALAGGVLLLCAALPLSTEDSGLSAYSVAGHSATVLEFVTPDERELLRAMRSSLSEWAERSGSSNETDVPLRAETVSSVVPQEVEQLSSARRKTTPVFLPSEPLAVRERAEEKEKRGIVPLEEVMALVQKGERALRETAVPVVEEDGEVSMP